MSGTLEILVGPIASGKSTYSRTRAEQGAVIVNDDAIVQAVHAGDYSLYDKSLKPVYKAVENQILQTALTLGRTVVVDRPNCSRAMRRRFIGIAKSLGAHVTAIEFPREHPKVHAERRYESDSRGLVLNHWMGVSYAQDVMFSCNTLSKDLEGFDELLHFDFASCEASPVEVCEATEATT